MVIVIVPMLTVVAYPVVGTCLRVCVQWRKCFFERKTIELEAMQLEEAGTIAVYRTHPTSGNACSLVGSVGSCHASGCKQRVARHCCSDEIV